MRRYWLAVLLCACAVLAHVQAQDLHLARLDADPPATDVVSGAIDGQFRAVAGPVLLQPDKQVHWWRVTASGAVGTARQPHLVLRSPYLHRFEIWLPGQAPLQRSLIGRDSDRHFSTRSIAIALPQGLARDAAVYLRVQSLASTPIPVAVESLESVHQRDLAHVTWRTAVLSMMAMLSVLALGLWVGVGDRSYQYLFLTLVAQTAYLWCIGGEIRAWPWLADLFSQDLRAIRFVTLLAALASSNFVAYYLSLPQRQPWMARVLRACNAAMIALMAACLFSAAEIISALGNIVLLVTMPSLFIAGVIGAWRRQREAYFVLLSWTPMVMVAVARVGELQRWWPFSLWMEYWIPICCVMSSLVLMTGVTYKIQQLRQDRDRATELATFDALTGALSRPMVETQLAALIEAGNREHRPLSVVFFDIDHFKRINDQHGHRMGDQALRIIVKRVRNRLREQDLLGRYGGDEMIAVLPGTDGQQAEIVAEHLREAVNCRPLSVDGTTLVLSLSLGVAEWFPGERADHLIERADAALYASKSAGRDRVTRYRPTTLQTEGAMT